MFETPILLIVFNRPEHTRKVLERLRELKPTRLFVAADGPRDGNQTDKIRCAEVRQLVQDFIDWPCGVTTRYNDKNFGCGLGPANSITWFFSIVDKGIILEDDCLPNLSFFRYCENLLGYYRDQPKVMHISGNNFQKGITRGDGSYYFSAYTHNWGWATWRDRWANFDFDLKNYTPGFMNEVSSAYHLSQRETTYWKRVFNEMVAKGRIDVWDFRWMIAVWANNGFSILPQVNLVENIGFDQQATHTLSSVDSAQTKASEIKKIEHPTAFEVNRCADYFTFTNHFHPEAKMVHRIVRFKKRLLKKLYQVFLFPIKLEIQYHRFKKFTMIPKKIFKANLRLGWQYRGVSGCVVECGTWKGGMIASLVEIAGRDRAYYLFDSFEGLPDVQDIDGPGAKAWQDDKDGATYFDNCRADENDARIAMELSGAKHYQITKGWFKDVLENFELPEGISILRLDGDWYESTMQCLTFLFPKVVAGGVVIIDDYYTWDGCAKAVHDYLSVNKLPYRIQSYKGVCVIVKQ